MTELTDLSETDASNVTITGINIDEGCAPSGMNNAARNTLGLLRRAFKSTIFRIRDATDQTKLLAFDLSGLTTATTRTLTAPNASGTIALTSDVVNPSNLALAASVGANALTISLKGADGNDPSATNVVNVPFRNVTLATGTPTYLAVTSATSLVISSGSTMGFTSAVAGRLWIVGFNDGGTFRLGAVNCLSGVNIMTLRDGIYSSTAEGGAGGADSAQVIYTGTAVTSKALTILGYMEWSAGLTTAGTWSIVPTTIQLMGRGIAKPGDTVQVQRSDTGALATGSTLIPYDDTIPQNTEGDQFMSQAITPTSAANLLRISNQMNVANSGASAFIASALFQDSAANGLKASSVFEATATGSKEITMSHAMIAATTTATTFKVRVGANVVGTTTFNGTSGARRYGGVMNSFLEVQEIMA